MLLDQKGARARTRRMRALPRRPASGSGASLQRRRRSGIWLLFLRQRLDRRAGADLLQVADDHAFTLAQALGHADQFAIHRSERKEPHLGLVARADDIDELAHLV